MIQKNVDTTATTSFVQYQQLEMMMMQKVYRGIGYFVHHPLEGFILPTDEILVGNTTTVQFLSYSTGSVTPMDSFQIT